MPTMPVRSSQVSYDTGGVDAALSSASQTLQATYNSAFQSHVSMGPACALADVKNGGATVWFGGQKPYRVRLAIADILKIPSANVRVIWAPGPGSYGTNDADDAAVEAAWISGQMGQPVRVQWTRADGIAWDPKAPAAVVSMKAGIDSQGNVSALDWVSWLQSGTQREAGALVAGDALIGMMMGLQPVQTDSYGFAAESYGFTQKRAASHVLNWDQAIGTGLRTAHLRDPQGPQTQFAWESFMDEIAAKVRMDPVQFRLAYNYDPLVTEVISAVARAANWDTRPSPRLNGGHPIAKGRGIAYAPRGSSYVATVAEVEVNRNTGQVRVTRFVCAHQSGLIINPNGIEGTIEANLIQSMSRALHEAVAFNQDGVTSVDYKTYPVVDITEVPDIQMVLVNRPDLPASGAGEPSTRPTAAAIGNAIFDATGARVRTQPMTPAVVKAALKG
jgi:CO/xanthine dehydrogenase Mo-binding subunit